MSMATVVLMVHDRSYRESLRSYFESAREERVVERGIPSAPASGFVGDWVIDVVARTADAIEEAAGSPAGLRRVLVLADAVGPGTPKVDLEGFNPLLPDAVADPWQSVVATLLLMFPEVHWVLLTPSSKPFADRSCLFRAAHLVSANNPVQRVSALKDAGYAPLFDPAGLRELVLENVRESRDDGKVLAPVPRRERLALAIDEESMYAEFLAYTAYRHGFRAQPVKTRRLLQSLLQTDGLLSGTGRPDVVFEDLYVSFPDRRPREHLSRMEDRNTLAPVLQDVPYRVLVTVGHDRGNPAQFEEFQRFVKQLADSGRGTMLLKPLSGVIDVWASAQLSWRLPNGLAPGYERFRGGAGSPDEGSHSAPGQLLQIADRIIRRARCLAESSGEMADAVHGAALALLAQELIGTRTPTTAFEAIALQHELEVIAECLFYGVDYHFDVKSRFEEIRSAVNESCSWFGKPERDRAVSSVSAGIINQLVLRFRNANQFDEEIRALGEAWSLRGSYIRPQSWYEDRFRQPGAPLSAIDRERACELRTLDTIQSQLGRLLAKAVEPCVGSPATFVSRVFLAVCVFAVWLSLAARGLEDTLARSLSHAEILSWVAYSAVTLFGLGTPDPKLFFEKDLDPIVSPVWFRLGLTMEVVLGFFVLGVLISAISLRVIRR
jgi:hypothetical protein